MRFLRGHYFEGNGKEKDAVKDADVIARADAASGLLALRSLGNHWSHRPPALPLHLAPSSHTVVRAAVALLLASHSAGLFPFASSHCATNPVIADDLSPLTHIIFPRHTLNISYVVSS
jgi:hypothetical protein